MEKSARSIQQLAQEIGIKDFKKIEGSHVVIENENGEDLDVIISKIEKTLVVTKGALSEIIIYFKYPSSKKPYALKVIEYATKPDELILEYKKK